MKLHEGYLKKPEREQKAHGEDFKTYEETEYIQILSG